jgi:transcriptional regulator with XRE-family HTH domain
MEDQADRETARKMLRDFLISRRARISPTEAGLPAYGSNRRVKGLRREEVAMLAGISAEYYVRLERGQAAGASSGVVDAVADVLQLNNDEREHLSRLLLASQPAGRKKRHSTAPDTVRPGIQVLLDALNHVPAFVFNGRLDIIAANDLGRALYAPIFDDPVQPANPARFTFLREERAREFWPTTWEAMADDAVAMLRAEAGRRPNDPALIELVGHLSTRSQEFRTRWGAHDVRQHKAGVKALHHPIIGSLALPFENFTPAAEPDQVLMAYTPQPGTPAHDAIVLLASLTTSPRAATTSPERTPPTLE